MGTTTNRSIAVRLMDPIQILFLFILPFLAFAQDPNSTFTSPYSIYLDHTNANLHPTLYFISSRYFGYVRR